MNIFEYEGEEYLAAYAAGSPFAGSALNRTRSTLGNARDPMVASVGSAPKPALLGYNLLCHVNDVPDRGTH